METMFLVAGLAVAGLVGIAAAFYFSIRSGNRGGKRLRSARPDLSRPDLSGRPRRTADGGRPPVTTFTPAASARPRRPGAARTAEPVGARRLADTQALPEDPWPGDAEAGNPWPDDAWPDDSMSGDPNATDGIERWMDDQLALLSTSDPVIEDGPVHRLVLVPRD